MFIPNTSFEVLEDTRPDDVSLPAFMVSTTRGFLPRIDPIVALPQEFDAVEDLLRASESFIVLIFFHSSYIRVQKSPIPAGVVS
jgi:hypothetical protein